MLICEFINDITVQLIMTILRRTEVNLYVILSKASVEVFVQQRATCTALKQRATQWCTAAWNQRVSKDCQAMKTEKWNGDFYGKPSNTALEWLQIIQIHIECHLTLKYQSHFISTAQMSAAWVRYHITVH